MRNYNSNKILFLVCSLILVTSVVAISNTVPSHAQSKWEKVGNCYVIIEKTLGNFGDNRRICTPADCNSLPADSELPPICIKSQPPEECKLSQAADFFKRFFMKLGETKTREDRFNMVYKEFYNSLINQGYSSEQAHKIAHEQATKFIGSAGKVDFSIFIPGKLPLKFKIAPKIPGGKSPGAKGPGGDPPASAPMGSRSCQMNQPKNPSYQPVRNSPTKIDGRDYSGHALDRMQDRGITPTVVDNTIKTGTKTTKGSENIFYDQVNDVTVVTDSNTGRVVTVMHGGH